jgi:hypothetical protein
MVKSADTADLKSADPYQVVGVQVPLRAPIETNNDRGYVRIASTATGGLFAAQNVPGNQFGNHLYLRMYLREDTLIERAYGNHFRNHFASRGGTAH